MPGPPGLPVVGNLPELARDPLAFFSRCARDYGDVVRFRVPGVTAYLLSHPDHIEDLLITQRHNFIKGRAVQANRPLLGDGLLTSEGEDWLRDRRLVQPAFHRDRIAGHAGLIVERAMHMLSGWRDGQKCAIDRELSWLVQEIAAQTLLGVDIGDALPEAREAFGTCLAEFRAGMRTGFLVPAGVPTPGNLRLRRAVGRLDAIVYRVIAERRAHLDEEGDRPDMLTLLLRSMQEQEQAVPQGDRRLRDEVVTLFVAGHETTGIALTFTCYLLARHPAVQAQLLAELEARLDGRLPTAADLPLLPFTQMVIKEALRLYPPAWALVRTAIRDCEIGGQRLRAGDSVTVSQWVLHHDARYFARPYQFEPERWAAPGPLDLPRFAYFPFGGGPRGCIGEGLALLELGLIVATIVPRFGFELTSARDLELLPSITLRPRDSVEVRLTKRRGP